MITPESLDLLLSGKKGTIEQVSVLLKQLSENEDLFLRAQSLVQDLHIPSRQRTMLGGWWFYVGLYHLDPPPPPSDPYEIDIGYWRNWSHFERIALLRSKWREHITTESTFHWYLSSAADVMIATAEELWVPELSTDAGYLHFLGSLARRLRRLEKQEANGH